SLHFLAQKAAEGRRAAYVRFVRAADGRYEDGNYVRGSQDDGEGQLAAAWRKLFGHFAGRLRKRLDRRIRKRRKAERSLQLGRVRHASLRAAQPQGQPEQH